MDGDDLRFWGQGTWKDDTLCGWPACKRQHPMAGDNIGFLGLASTPPGASVYIDGSLVPGMTAATPGEPLRLAPGTHTLRLTLSGYKDVTADLVVQNGKTVQYSAVFEPAGAAPAPKGPSPSRFEPTEKVRADFDVSFPIDI